MWFRGGWTSVCVSCILWMVAQIICRCRLNDGCNSGLIRPHLSIIFQFLEIVSQENEDESITKNSIGLVGDLAASLMPHAGEVHSCVVFLASHPLDFDHDTGSSVLPTGFCQ